MIVLEIKQYTFLFAYSIYYIYAYVHTTYVHTYENQYLECHLNYTYMYSHIQYVHSNIHAYIHVFICCRSVYQLSLTWKYLYWKIQVTRNHPTWKRPQNGIVALRDTSVALNMALYLAESEQRLGAMITDVTNFLSVTHCCCSSSGGDCGSGSSSSSYCRSK